MSHMELSLTQKQTLSPALQTSLHLLKLNNLQLRTYLNDLMLRNPVVELAPPEFDFDLDPFQRRRARTRITDDENDDGNPIEEQAGERDFLEELLMQAAILDVPRETADIVRYLLLSLDENGFLSGTPDSLALELDVPIEAIREAVRHLQTLEPAGVGAFDLAECLCLQLRRRKPVNALALLIAESHLDKMADQKYAQIAKTLHASKQDVIRACNLIRTLTPKPLNGLGRQMPTHYIIPDFYITVTGEDHIQCTMNDYYLPRIRIDATYEAMLRDKSLAGEARTYLQEKYQEATETEQFVTYRKSTMLRIMEHILPVQRDFFLQGPGHLHPMSNADLAEALSLHESTVSRAVSGKFFECQWGVFPLKSLFTRQINDSESDHVRARIRDLIRKEPPGAAHSDQHLTELLAEEGITISRRTVVKYRQQLGLPASHERNRAAGS